ncbi:MAG: hypothetical protein OXR03_02675, partial [Rhodospirillaceae bacterium]|nr:hypothetical protein [Rhodospirillaceae bacterium]
RYRDNYHRSGKGDGLWHQFFHIATLVRDKALRKLGLIGRPSSRRVSPPFEGCSWRIVLNTILLRLYRMAEKKFDQG